MDRLNNVLSVLRTNPYVSATTTLFLVLYAGLAAPALPASIAVLFDHSVFKLLILVLVLVLLKGQNITVALLVAVGFVISMGTLSRYRVFKLADELTSLNPLSKGKPIHSSDAPDSTNAKWSSENGVNHLNIRGHEYAGHDGSNHLPGGHGDMDRISGFSNAQEPSSYNGPCFSTVSGPDCQL